MYEQHINVTTTGLETAEKAVSVTGALEDRTRRLSQVIADRIAGDEKLLGKQLDLIKSETTLEGLREKHRMQTEALAASTNRAADSQEKLNTATRKTVTDVQAASGALRAMEGTLPIRAVEQFTTKVLGLGPAFQALFPLVGAVAAIGLLERGITKVGELYNAWNPVITAQEKSLKILQESNREFDGLIKKSDQYRLDTYEREHGRPARLRMEADEAAGDASYNDAARVRYIQGRISEQEKIVGAGTAARAPIPMMGGMIGSVPLSGPSDMQRQTARETLVGLYAQLDVAQLKQKVDNQNATDLRAKAKESEEKKIDTVENQALELRKRAAEAMARAYFGSSPEGRSAYDQVKLRMEEAEALRRDAEQSRQNRTPSQAASIRGSYTLLRTAAYGENRAAIAKRDMDEDAALADVGASATAHLQRSELTDEKGERSELEAFLRTPRAPVPVGYRSPAQQLRDARDEESRYSSLARVKGQLGGISEGDQIASQSAARIRFADREYQAQLRVNEAKLRGADLEEANADALDQKHQKIFDAEMGRQQALLEIALRQKEGFQSAVVGLVRAARSGNVGGFLRGQAERLGDKVVSNAAGMAWESISQVIPHASGTLGKLLQGTPFGPDPTKAAQQDNTLATRANTDATNSLTTALTGGGTVAGGGGIAGAAGGGSGTGTGTTSLPAAISGISKTLAAVAKYGGAAFAGYEGISALTKGGARNTVTGIGELAGAAAMVDPEPISKAVLGIVAGATGLISGLMGDPRANRSSAIAKALQTNQFMDPVRIDASMTTGGGFADYDRFGGVRGSNLSPFPSVQQGYFDYRNGVTIPGRTVNQFGGGPAPQVTIQVQAMDAKSIIDRHQEIGSAVLMALDSGHTGLSERLHGN